MDAGHRVLQGGKGLPVPGHTGPVWHGKNPRNNTTWQLYFFLLNYWVCVHAFTYDLELVFTVGSRD